MDNTQDKTEKIDFAAVFNSFSDSQRPRPFFFPGNAIHASAFKPRRKAKIIGSAFRFTTIP